MEMTVKKFLGPMIEDFAVFLDRQQRQNLAEWALKCAMCSDSIEAHQRFFTEAECRAFREKRAIPPRTLVFAARFTGRSLDSNGVDFTLIEPQTKELLVRGHVFTMMVGHVVLQVLSWHPDPQHENEIVQMQANDGPWGKLTIQIWPIKGKSVMWPPPLSLSTVKGPRHYGYFRVRFKKDSGHRLLKPKPKPTVQQAE